MASEYTRTAARSLRHDRVTETPMNDSNFDPKNPNSAGVKGGMDRYLSPPAKEASKLPTSAIDGKAELDAPEDNDRSHEALPADEAARKLAEMQSMPRQPPRPPRPSGGE